jgi:phosphinothricin acetyltransferase
MQLTAMRRSRGALCGLKLRLATRLGRLASSGYRYSNSFGLAAADRQIRYAARRRVASAISIRNGVTEDLPAIAEIYNFYVNTSHATFELDPVTVSSLRPWFDEFDSAGPYQIFVVEKLGSLVGYATSNAFHPKEAYVRSVETGIFLKPSACGGGVGTQLYGALIDSLATESSVERLVAGITLPNEPSLALHLKLNFQAVGTFSRVSYKGNRFYDLCWLDRPVRLAA